MNIEQLYTNCLAQAAYYIESNGEVAIIDPIRDIESYLTKLTENGHKLKFIFETHFHADFVSGHIDLAKKTGATIVYGPETKTAYPVYVAKEGEQFAIGDLKLEVIHTQGHTLESSCFLLKDASQKNSCVFTGDTLFVGDVGRPDLLDGVMTKEELAGLMYESLKKLTVLEDDVIVYPAHGPCSACGKNIGKETSSTIGIQKQTNYALQPMDKTQFIQAVTEGISAAPAYFFEDAKLNKNGYKAFDAVITEANKSLTVDEFEALAKQGATIIDTRLADFFELGFVPGSINIGLNGQYAIWAATVLPLSSKLIIVAKPGTEKESIERLTRVGFEHILGYLSGGFDAWKEADKRYDMVISIYAEELALDAKHNKNAVVVDVRKPTEFKESHVKEAMNLPLADLPLRYSELDKSKECLVHCAVGYRSMVAASILKKQGFSNVKNVWGGFSKIKEESIELVTGE